jgi:DNA integrity scanning protein DisA with diadenylate cyclase activity
MRWNAAIVEMDRYYKTPVLYRNMGIEMFCNFIEDSVKEASFLELICGNEAKTNSYESKEFGIRNIRTIFPFFILKNNEVLSIDNVKKLYTLLNSDLSAQFEDSSLEIIRLAAQKCHIGQAVNVKYGTDIESAVLRISLGARVISESWTNRDISLYFRNIETQMNQITVILKKIELILSHPDLLN